VVVVLGVAVPGVEVRTGVAVCAGGSAIAKQVR
jgi:hypothetical protein